MNELTDEQSNFEEYQSLIEALRKGAEKLSDEPGHMLSVFHIGVLNGLKISLDNPEHLLAVYHRTSKPPEDHKGEPVVWDLAIEYNGEKVPLRRLVDRLEILWNEFRMLNEGGV